MCDNPVEAKHLDANTRLLAEILLLSTICIRVYITYLQSKPIIYLDYNVTTPQENGHLTVAAVGKLMLVVILWEPWRPPFILPDYGLAVRTELHT
jgi:hypothetical protein